MGTRSNRDPRLAATILYPGASWDGGTFDSRPVGLSTKPEAINLGNENVSVTGYNIRKYVDLTDKALKGLGLAKPKIAVAAMNPHAGEGGLFGRQDIDVSTPVIEKANAEGLDVHGPVPGDTVFVKLRAGQYDAVVAMFHDQGHIPVKLLGFSVDPRAPAQPRGSREFGGREHMANGFY